MTFGNNIQKTLFPLFCGICFLLTVSCQKKGGGATDITEDPSNLGSPFGRGEIDDTLKGPDLQSGGGTKLTSTDKTALKNLADEFEDVEPVDDGTAAISKALEQKMKELLAAEKAGKDVAMQKMALAGQMMQECAKRVSELAPRPEQPLLGAWSGTGCAKTSGKFTVPGANIPFNLISPYDRGPGQGTPAGAPYVVKVEGATNGKLTTKDGAGRIEAVPWAGNVSDQGLAGRASAGTVVMAAYNQTKTGPQSCTMGVSLKASRSPIPENYIEAMRKSGKCYRTTLVLMSPVLDSMFKGMDPALAQVLKVRMLGIK